MSASPLRDHLSPISTPRSSNPNGRAPATDLASVKSRSPTSTASTAGSKRKRGGDPKLYAVRSGHHPGIYFSWSDCLAQIKGFKNAICKPTRKTPSKTPEWARGIVSGLISSAAVKSFTTISDAEAFLAGKDPTQDPTSASYGSQKFYAVQNGRVPGIYTDWPSAQKQITGWTKPKHRCFATRAEAEDYLRRGKDHGLQKTEETEIDDPEPATYANDDPSVQLLHEAAQFAKNIKPPAKKPRKSTKTDRAAEGNSLGLESQPLGGNEWGPGQLMPLPDDGFDPQMVLNPLTGEVEIKSEFQMQRHILQSNGPRPDDVLCIWTDGSSLGNGKGGAMAGIGVYFGPEDVRNVSEPLTGSRQTNNRAELTAILRALDIAPRNREVLIHTDSSYSINCVTTWFKSWRKNNWMGTNGKPVENRDLIEAILGKIEQRTGLGVATNFQWLRGHAGDEGNVEADRLAVNGAKQARG